MKAKITTQKADEAFRQFYSEFENNYPTLAQYVEMNTLYIAWNSGVIWAIDETLKKLSEAINS